MASVLLQSAGSQLGSSVGGPIGKIAGRFVGSLIGNAIDDKIFGPRRLADAEGPRLEDLSVQTSTYGKAIPVVYGNARLAGNVIWSRPIKETVRRKNVQGGGKGGGGKVVQKQTTYTYSISLAIAICEGEIDDVVKVWADAKPISPSSGTYRLYKGTETQNPDSYIESFEGAGKTPAYRGMAYVVIEDFPLADYGNRIPNFTFEVRRKLTGKNAEVSVEEKIKEVVMIPASGEFAYDTVVQTKIPGEDTGSGFIQKNGRITINQNNRSNKADALVALDQLELELPNVEWISVVVGWFGNSLDAATCVIKPGVEYVSGATTAPEVWSVASFNRSTAHAISYSGGGPIYGGTPDDQSLVRYVTELRARGYKILFYPFVFMDMAGKPWRGRITGASSDVANFFTKTNGYNAFVNHYASLLNGKVDAFCIGSELIGLTKVKDGSNNFSGVNALVGLAQSVKTTLGSGVKVTYAADWSEYHHTDGGWYNLDPLWASPYIDVIGIDAYFPLTDEPQDGYDKQKIMDGWTSGEGYDWYYTDVARTSKANLAAAYAWKNLNWWWNNYHTNPVGGNTAWVPQSKKIWFTEFGFPSVDGATNQPNVFYDPSSSESALPRFSNGRVDFRIQRTAIDATMDKWAGSNMIERKFLWTWDARPYPFYPDLRDVWSDGNLWLYGHWVQGKLGLSSLAAIIEDLAKKAELDENLLDTDKVYDLVQGFVINGSANARAGLEQLQKAYFLDTLESDRKIKFIARGQEIAATISENELIGSFDIVRTQELELPERLEVSYIDQAQEYQVGTQSSARQVTDSALTETQNLPIVLNSWQAKKVSEVSLYNVWTARGTYQFSLPIKYAYLEPSDVIEVEKDGAVHCLRVVESLLGANGQINVKAVAEDVSVYDAYIEPNNDGVSVDVIPELAGTAFEILDMPSVLNDASATAYLRFAACGYSNNWQGAAIYRSDDGGVSYNQISEILEPATIGYAITALPVGVTDVRDEVSQVTVSLINGELESITDDALLNGGNAAILGDEIIQFKTATLVTSGKYILSGLLRGRMGTESYSASHAIGERFVLLDSTIVREQVPNYLIGVSRKYKAVSFGQNLSDVAAIDFTFNANNLKPLSVTSVSGSRDGGNNLTISWIRRTRIGGELRDLVDVPLNEETERYEVNIMNGVNVVRTISVNAASASYSAANQVTDFGAAQTSVSVRIYQISAIVGRGFVASAII